VRGANGAPDFNVDFSDFADLFSDLFGFGGFGRTTTRRARNAPRRGTDLQHRLDLTFEEAVFGIEKKSKSPVTSRVAIVVVAAPSRAPHQCAARPAMARGRCAR